MIEVYYSENSLKVSGHAGQAPCGSDVVCAGVSTLCAALGAYLDAERSKGALFLTVLEQSKGEFRCAFVRDREGKGREALSLAVMGLRLIAASHPENLKMIRGKQGSVA